MDEFPAEIRNRIYEYTLDTENPLRVILSRVSNTNYRGDIRASTETGVTEQADATEGASASRGLSLLLACRRFRVEASPIFWGNVTVDLSMLKIPGSAHQINSFIKSNRTNLQHVRHIVLSTNDANNFLFETPDKWWQFCQDNCREMYMYCTMRYHADSPQCKAVHLALETLRPFLMNIETVEIFDRSDSEFLAYNSGDCGRHFENRLKLSRQSSFFQDSFPKLCDIKIQDSMSASRFRKTDGHPWQRFYSNEPLYRR